MNSNISRRSLLASIGAMTITGLAGCSNSSPSNDSNPGTTNPPAIFDSIEGQGTKLTVTLSDRAAATTLQLNSGGEKVATVDVSNAKKGTFDIGVNYTPGEHTLLAIKNEEIVAETTVDISPSLELVGGGLGINHVDELPEWTSPRLIIYFDIKNSGSGADKATKLLSPDTPRELTEDWEATGFQTEEMGDTTPVVPAGATKRIYSTPIMTASGPQPDWECGQSHRMDFTIKFEHHAPIEKTFRFDSTLKSKNHDSFNTPPDVIDDVCSVDAINITE
ncbi:MAG: hypothetical protein ABEI86_06360 [Halobacteriaceae archaeon]